MASHNRKPNTLLRQQRLLKGWTLERLADELHVFCREKPRVGARGDINAQMVSRWETGKHPPSLYYQEKLCQIFSKSAQELGFIQGQHGQKAVSMGEADSQSKQQYSIPQIPDIAGASLFNGSQDSLNLPLWERLSRALATSSDVDEITLNTLVAITRSYWQLREKIAYRDLLGGFLGYLETVTQLLRYSHPLITHKHLCSIASEIAQRIGAIYFDMKDYPSAQVYYRVSVEAAQEAENDVIWAIGLGRMSSLPMYNGQSQDALPLLQEAQRLASTSATASTRAWLASIEAEAHAYLQNSSACFQLLEHAESLVGQIKPEDSKDGINFDYARLLGYKGGCFLYLQEFASAFLTLQEARNSIGGPSVRQQSIFIADSALALTKQGEIEEACKLTQQACTMTVRTKSELVKQRIRGIRHEMKPWEATRVVKELDEQLAASGPL